MDSKYNILQKQARARVIKRHLAALGTDQCVCFSCGNSIRYLKQEGLIVTPVGANETLRPAAWFMYTQIQQQFNGLFDATSGHLPWPLMLEVAKELGAMVRDVPDRITLPTGSGETLVCLKLALPHLEIHPVYNLNAATQFNQAAPLNGIVQLLKGKPNKYGIKQLAAVIG